MMHLIDLEKKINSKLTTKIKGSEIKHNQLYLNIDSEDIIEVSLFIKSNEDTKFRQLIDITVVDYNTIFNINLSCSKLDGKRSF